MTAIDRQQLIEYHCQHFGYVDHILAVPGRANIIGEHTDYNGGLVLPFCIDKHIWFTWSERNAAGHLNILSAQYCDFYISENAFQQGSWQFFVHNFLKLCREKKLPVKNLNICFGGDLPIGAGMSSSSALVCGLIEVFDRSNTWSLTTIDKIKIASEVEHGAGVNGGLMDQSVIFAGRKNHALLIDCGDLSFEYVNIPDDWCFFLLDTNVKHNLVNTEYNRRRKICDTALEKMKVFRNTDFLCEWPIHEMDMLNHILSEEEFQKVSFVINENQRVLEMKLAMKLNNMKLAGELLNRSHQGLSYQYEVSTPELDYLVNKANEYPEIFGSRMMGGGFGGGTINLCRDSVDDEYINSIINSYLDAYHLPCTYYALNTESGIAEQTTA